MNHIRQLNRLEIRLKSYLNFMPYCPRDSFLKLSNEIVKISDRIDIINRMSLSESLEEVTSYYDTKQSKINFKTV